jgi:hypothetical protein
MEDKQFTIVVGDDVLKKMFESQKDCCEFRNAGHTKLEDLQEHAVAEMVDRAVDTLFSQAGFYD